MTRESREPGFAVVTGGVGPTGQSPASASPRWFSCGFSKREESRWKRGGTCLVFECLGCGFEVFPPLSFFGLFTLTGRIDRIFVWTMAAGCFAALRFDVYVDVILSSWKPMVGVTLVVHVFEAVNS